MKRARIEAAYEAWAGSGGETRRRLLGALTEADRLALIEAWIAHGGQIEPPGDWRVWAIVAGRGFGKTRAGAEWVWARVRADRGTRTSTCPQGPLRIALVAASLDEAAKVMVEGESGLIAAARAGEEVRWRPHLGTLRFPGGAEAFTYTAERPEKLRGPQHHHAWCDELAKWPGTGAGRAKADLAWDNLMLGLRLGERPRTIVTTTPQPVALLKRILALPHCRSTHGRTDDNPHLPADFRAAVAAMYGGTRLGRQELEGILLEDVEGALWTRAIMEGARLEAPLPREALVRVVIGVDPPASAGGDSCGIVACGLGRDGIAYVLADHSVAGLRPEGWARRVAAAAAEWEAQLVVAEQNQGGEMIESVLRGVDAELPVRLVSATRGKAARAEPVALRFETGRARLAGRFPELEDELCAITYAGYQGPGRSPDRADAMVWAISELIERRRAPPSIRLL